MTFWSNLRLSGVSDPHSWERSCTIFPQGSCSRIWTASEFPRDLLTHRVLGPSPRVLDSDDLARDPIFVFLSNGGAVGWGSHFGNHYPRALGRGMLMSIGHCIISFHCERTNSWANCLEKLRRTKRTSGEQKKTSFIKFTVPQSAVCMALSLCSWRRSRFPEFALSSTKCSWRAIIQTGGSFPDTGEG